MHIMTPSVGTALVQPSAAEAARAQAQAAREQAQVRAQAARGQAQATRDQAQQLKDQIREQIRADFNAAREGAVAGIDGPGGGFVQLPNPPTPPPGPFSSGTGDPPFGPIIPPQVVDIVGILGVTLVCCVVGFPLARAIARWIDRRGTVSAAPREVMTRLDAIEQAVESVAVEVERINEGQRFTARMLSERTHQPAPDFHAAGREAVPVGSPPRNVADNAPANARRS